MHERLKMVDAILTQGGESSAIICVGSQATLHPFTNFNILLLNLVAEGDDLLHAFPTGARAR